MTEKVIIREIRERMKFLESKINEIEGEYGYLRNLPKYRKYSDDELNHIGSSITKRFHQDGERIRKKSIRYRSEYMILKDMEYAYRNSGGEY